MKVALISLGLVFLMTIVFWLNIGLALWILP